MRNRIGGVSKRYAVLIVGAVIGLSAWTAFPQASNKPVEPYEGIAVPYRVADVMKTDPGTQVPWSKIEFHARKLTFVRGLGESKHLLRSSKMPGRDAKDPKDAKYAKEVLANIYPVKEIWNVDLDAAKTAHIIALIEASGDFPPLRLKQGNNFLMVWWDGDIAKMAVLNAQGRAEISMDYTPHGGVTGGAAGAGQQSRLSRAVLQCTQSVKRKACFVDSKEVWQAPASSGEGGAMGIDLNVPQGFDTQPWIACLVTGCCCGGGTNCH